MNALYSIVLGPYLVEAVIIANKRGDTLPITTAHLLLAIIEDKSLDGTKMLSVFGLDIAVLREELCLRISKFVHLPLQTEKDSGNSMIFSSTVEKVIAQVSDCGKDSEDPMITVHLILLFVKEEQSLAGKILRNVEVDKKRISRYLQQHEV